MRIDEAKQSEQTKNLRKKNIQLRQKQQKQKKREYLQTNGIVFGSVCARFARLSNYVICVCVWILGMVVLCHQEEKKVQKKYCWQAKRTLFFVVVIFLCIFFSLLLNL